jgi:hypothetical protein
MDSTDSQRCFSMELCTNTGPTHPSLVIQNEMTAKIQHFKHMIALASIPGRRSPQDIVGFLQSAHSEAHITA